MSSILPFIIVAVIMTVVASMALGAAAQPATDGDKVARDPWRDRIRPVTHWCARSARDVRVWLLAGLRALGGRFQDHRSRRASAKAERRAQRTSAKAERRAQRTSAKAERRAQRDADRVKVAGEATAGGPKDATPEAGGDPTPATLIIEPPRPEGVVTTALRVKPDIAIAEGVGDEVSPKGPGLLVRVRSALGLVLLITLLGLGLAVALAAVVAAMSSAVDSFVN